MPTVLPCQFKQIIKNQIKIYTREISLGKLISSKIPKIHLFSLISIKIPVVADQRGCHGLRGCGCQYGSSFSLSNVLFLSYYTFQTVCENTNFLGKNYLLDKTSHQIDWLYHCLN